MMEQHTKPTSRKNEQGGRQLAAFLYDSSCERSVAGALIKYTWAFPQEAARLQTDLFGDPLCRVCMEAVERLSRGQGEFGEMEIMWEIQKEHAEISIVDLIELVSMAASNEGQLATYVSHLADLHTRRRLAQLSTLMWERANDAALDLDETLGMLHREFDSVLRQGTPQGITTLTEALADLQRLVSDRQEGIVEDTGTMVGFPELDDDGGLMPGQLVVIAGATAHGKSALALSFVRHILEQRLPMAYFSLEMTTRELSSRLLSMESGVSSARQLHPSRPLGESEFVDVARAFGQLEQYSAYLHFDAHFTANVDQICGAIRSMHFLHGIRGVVIDYLQILNTSQTVNNREQFMAEVARRFKNLAVELGIWIVTLSQFNRNDTGEEPTLNRLRDSGQIAEAADRVLLIHRPEANGHGGYAEPFQDVDTHHTALLNLAKNRNGATKRFVVDYHPARTLFASHRGDLPRLRGAGDAPDRQPLSFRRRTTS